MGVIYEIWTGIKDDLEDLWFYIKYELWINFYNTYPLHIWRHYFLHQRCENCRNWIYEGREQNREVGYCTFEGLYNDYHAHCYCWNMEHDPSEDERGYTWCPDGWEIPRITPVGKRITQISKNGRWMYLYDGDPIWLKD